MRVVVTLAQSSLWGQNINTIHDVGYHVTSKLYVIGDFDWLHTGRSAQKYQVILRALEDRVV